jgi:hypothetical protein
MKEYVNVWGIKEFEGDGVSCPIIPGHLSWYQKTILTFFRFGICPMCIILSLTYHARKHMKNFTIRKELKKNSLKDAMQ